MSRSASLPRFSSRRVVAVAFVLVAGSFLLAACGKMPSDVDPPAGVSGDVYTRVYPDSQTDQKP
jgi:hypothetical protein